MLLLDTVLWPPNQRKTAQTCNFYICGTALESCKRTDASK